MAYRAWIDPLGAVDRYSQLRKSRDYHPQAASPLIFDKGALRPQHVGRERRLLVQLAILPALRASRYQTAKWENHSVKPLDYNPSVSIVEIARSFLNHLYLYNNTTIAWKRLQVCFLHMAIASATYSDHSYLRIAAWYMDSVSYFGKI